MGAKPEVTKPKLWSNRIEAEEEAEALTYWEHEAEAEAEALAFSAFSAEAQVFSSYYKYPG